MLSLGCKQVALTQTKPKYKVKKYNPYMCVSNHPVMGKVNIVLDTGDQFLTIVERLKALLTSEQPDAVITNNGKVFTAKYDTKDYTIHEDMRTGDYSPKLYQELGPMSRGFVIKVSVVPVNPHSAIPGPFHMPYWDGFFWYGHADDDKYIHFILKYGCRVDKSVIDRIIWAVIEDVQQPFSLELWCWQHLKDGLLSTAQ